MVDGGVVVDGHGGEHGGHGFTTFNRRIHTRPCVHKRMHIFISLSALGFVIFGAGVFVMGSSIKTGPAVTL